MITSKSKFRRVTYATANTHEYSSQSTFPLRDELSKQMAIACTNDKACKMENVITFY